MEFLKNLAEFEYRHTVSLFVVLLALTFVIALGIPSTQFQTDMSEEMPQDMDVVVLGNRVSDLFGGSDTLLILVSLDESSSFKNAPRDIRDPQVIEMLVDMESIFEERPEVVSVQSVGSIFEAMGSVPQTLGDVKSVLDSVGAANQFFNEDFSATFMVVSADLGTSQEKISDFVEGVEQDIDDLDCPGGVKIRITGNPPIHTLLADLVQSDMYTTIFLAALIIFVLLIFLERSAVTALSIMAPLVFGILWMIGLLGWSGQALSLVTAGLGAMILGLGTEYGVFVHSRYFEEREKGHSQEKSLRIALPSVGSSVIGSSGTTIVGFLALLSATIPMIQHLGVTLALGIACILLATLLVEPLAIILSERFLKRDAPDFLIKKSRSRRVRGK